MNGETKKDHVGESVRGKMGERERERKNKTNMMSKIEKNEIVRKD